ncbi:unnamed protein product [Durusdinium trenchii]|uniref:formate--tetrahydrofolate ligase n=1 Tax=Durusdinium trenchii TaxID=1381693 RepID=A0ABP0RR81_9DINO
MDFLHSATEALYNSFSPSNKSEEAAVELRATLGEGLCVCVVGEASNELSRAVATQCSEVLGKEAVFVTSGQDSAHVFADFCTSEVFHLVPTWDSTGFRGTDLPVGTDAQDCSAILGTLGEAFLVFPGAEPEVLTKAAARSAAILPLLNAEPSAEKPWFVTEEQWKVLRDPEAAADKVAAACASALGSFDIHHKAVAEPDQCDELCYVDPDAERWAQLAEVAQMDVPDVKKGKMRLQGSFQGTATTHTHQMDLNIGVNMEMPSKVAAKTMKQLSDSGLVPQEAQEALESERRSSGVFGALADYFRKDSQDATADVSSMIMNSMQMKLDDVHATYEAQQEELRQALDEAKSEVHQMTKKVKQLEEENQILESRSRQDSGKLNGNDKEAELEALRGQLSAKDAELSAKAKELEAASIRRKEDLEDQAQAAKDLAALNRLEKALHQAHARLEALEQEKLLLQGELNELKASHARACGELDSLREMPSPSAHREARAKLEEKQQECEGLAQKLAVTEAVARDAKRRLEDLEAQVSALTGREAEAKSGAQEASNQLLEKAEEMERLRAENQEMKEELAKVTTSERRLTSTVAQLNERLSASAKPETGSRPSSSELQKLLKLHQDLQVEHEKCLKSLDGLQGERANWQDEMVALKKTCSQLRHEADQVKTTLVAEVAGKAASVAQVAQEKEVASTLKQELAEQQHRFAQVSAEASVLAAKVKDLEAKLRHVSDRSDERAFEQSRAAGEEREGAELRRQLQQAVEEQLQAVEKAKAWQQHLETAQSQIADLTSELEALRKSSAEERIMAATRELSEEDMDLSLTASEDKQLRSRPGVSRSVIVRSMPMRSGALGTRASPMTTYKSMPATAPQTMQAGRRTGKVTHIGTTTTIGNVSVFSPSAEVSGTLSNSPLPAPAFSQVATVQRSSVGATPVASVQLPTAAGLGSALAKLRSFNERSQAKRPFGPRKDPLGKWPTESCPTARPVKPVSPVPSDIDIAQSDVFSYGPYKGKINLNIWSKLKDKPNGHYVVVCGINPTPLGEGKSTTTVGLSQALGAFLGQKVLTNIRQPSMGPTFGIKGGAAGGGYAQCFPMEDFNLHMTGDIHAITAAHNLFAAAIDTRYYHENSSSAKGIWNRLCPVDKNGKREFEPTMYARLEKLGLGHKKENPDLLTEEEIEKFCILDIDPDTITWKRVTDCSDKYLRKVEIGLSPSEFSKKKNEQMKRTSSYGITVSSESTATNARARDTRHEIMAILALATDLKDLRSRLGKMICCYSKKGEPITADDFGITGALAVLMMDALPPNTMQTLEGTPALVHAGPFANIAHGNSSIISDLIGLKLVGKDGYVLTEAGFGSDMGGEKFFNIKCYYSGLKPDCAVIVCSVRALKLHSCEAPKIVAGQTPAKEYREENLDLVEKGCANLIAHIQNVRKHGVKAVVAINRFGTDTDAELALVKKIAEENGAFAAVVAEHHAKGGAGATALGEAVMAACKTPSDFKFLYDAKKDSIKSKILKVVQEVYGGADVKYSEKAEAVLSRYQADPAINCLPICMSKTQYSLSDDAKKLGDSDERPSGRVDDWDGARRRSRLRPDGAPKGFTITVQDMYVSAGAGFIVVSLGDITFMPGLPIKPAYYKIDLDFTQDPPRVVGLS